MRTQQCEQQLVRVPLNDQWLTVCAANELAGADQWFRNTLDAAPPGLGLEPIRRNLLRLLPRLREGVVELPVGVNAASRDARGLGRNGHVAARGEQLRGSASCVAR